MIDVTVEQWIAAPPERVAAVMFDPARDREWIGGARNARLVSNTGFPEAGGRVSREGGFLGRRFEWTTEVAEHVPDRRLEMRHISGPFVGGVIYEIAPARGGSLVTIHNHGRAKFAFPGIGLLVLSAVRTDLKRLKAIAERR